MIHREKVHSGVREVPTLEIDVDTVYIRYNIHTYKDNEEREGMEYDEDSYGLNEYLTLELAKENPDLAIIRQLIAKL